MRFEAEDCAIVVSIKELSNDVLKVTFYRVVTSRLYIYIYIYISASVYYCQRKPKNRKNGVGLGTRLGKQHTSVLLPPAVPFSDGIQVGCTCVSDIHYHSGGTEMQLR